MKSDFRELLKDDCKEYNKVAKRYLDLTPDNASEAFNLMKLAWSLAQRWSELQSMSRKIEGLDKVNATTTDFKNWAYQRYRQMQLIHEGCRVIWKAANDEERFLRMQGIGRNDIK